MRTRVLNFIFYIGLALVAVGTLFKIQHWPNGKTCQSAGVVLELIFLALVVSEILFSKKATLKVKIVYTFVYLILPVLMFLLLPAIILIFSFLILATTYLTRVRKKFLCSRSELLMN
jgi:hypothetical protein